MDCALEFNDIWKRFRRGQRTAFIRDAVPRAFSRLWKGRACPADENFFWALKGISFRLEKGKMLGVIGPNGAGKTTILNLLAGILEPNKGDIRINGRISCLIIAGAGFQNEFTGRENIYLNGAIMGMRKKEIDRKFDSIVEFAGYGFPGYEKFIDTPLKWYSSGMFVRLGFAIAAHVAPDILLVDEILAVGNAMFQKRCFEYMNDLKRNGTTVVLVSHNMYHIVNYCDRAIFIKDSKINADGEPSKVVTAFEHASYKEARFGSSETAPAQDIGSLAMLDNVRIENAKKTGDGLILAYGQGIELGLDYECLEFPPEDLVFSMTAYRKNDACACFRVLSHMYDCHPKRGKGHVKLTVKDHNLLPGGYVFCVEIRSINSDLPLAIYREEDVLIEDAGKYLTPRSCGVYQPGSVCWDIN